LNGYSLSPRSAGASRLTSALFFIERLDMSETATPSMADNKAHHDDGHFKAYLTVFALLCVFTAVSFVCNELDRHGHISKHTSLAVIMGVAVIKALCVAVIFMHLKTDWPLVYFIMIPVMVMSVMMIIVLLPDIVLTWHHVPIGPLDAQP
jgi:caa(3)-type oxidase subunit IV